MYVNLCELRLYLFIFLGTSHKKSTQISLSKRDMSFIDAFLKSPTEELRRDLDTRAEMPRVSMCLSSIPFCYVPNFFFFHVNNYLLFVCP